MPEMLHGAAAATGPDEVRKLHWKTVQRGSRLRRGCGQEDDAVGDEDELAEFEDSADRRHFSSFVTRVRK
jgi:hypothetical protein